MMADERRMPQRASGPGWLATAGGALFLVAVGFSVGLVAGTAYQEPRLVADHLAGRTHEVAVEDEPAAAAPDVAAPAPPAAPEPDVAALGKGALDGAPRVPTRPPAAQADPVPEVAAAAAPSAAPAPVAKPANKPGAGESFSIQVGAFASEPAARQLAADLARRGYATFVADEGHGARFKVRVGPLGSRGEAETVSAQLKREHRLPTWILAGGKS